MARTDLTREQRIVALLSSYLEAREVFRSGIDGGASPDDGSRSRLLLMSGIWKEGSYVELERCLNALCQVDHELWWHVVARHVLSERRIREIAVKGSRYVDVPSCWRVTPPTPNLRTTYVRVEWPERKRRTVVRTMVESWDERVVPRKVQDAIDWISREFGGDVKLAKIHDGDNWHYLGEQAVAA